MAPPLRRLPYVPTIPQNASQRELVAAVQKVKESLDALHGSEVLDGHLIENVELSPFVDNIVQHKLGRDVRGYQVVRRAKVLSEFSAQLSGNYSLGSGGSGFIMPLAQEDLDEGGCYNNATYKYTTPVAGLYWFEVAGYLNAAGSTANYFDVFLRIDTTQYTDQLKLNNGANGNTSNTHARFRLTRGQVVEAWAYQNSGGAVNLLDSSPAYTYFKGGLVEEGITDRQIDLTPEERKSRLLLRCSYTQTVSLWVF